MGEAESSIVDRARIMEAILDNTMAVVYAKDLAGRYQLINRRFEELFGIAEREIKGRTDFDVFPKELAEKFQSNDRAIAEQNVAIEFEEIAPHVDGPHTYISLKFPYRDENGHCIGMCGVSTDITPRKNVDAALKESEERFRQLADNIPECFWIIDVATWQVLYVSPAFEEIWGIPCDALIKNPRAWTERIHPEDRQRVIDAFTKNVIAGGYQEEYRIIQPNGSLRWILDRGFPVRNEQRKAFRVAGVAQDITQRRALEQQVTEISSHERQRISRELHDSLGQQLTGLGFLAKGLADRLENVSSDDMKTAEDILDGIQDAVAEVRRVVIGLAPVDLNKHGLAAALQDLAKRISGHSDIECVFVCPRPIGVSNNNTATQLFRIAQEATNNAVKHSGASCIRISLLAAERKLTLEILDDGTGKDAQTDDAIGMGLRIMRYRSRIIGGSFDILSEADGTTVTCTLLREKEFANRSNFDLHPG